MDGGHGKVLAMLGGASAVAPMLFDELLERSGLRATTLQSILDALFEARQIQRCQITRNGQTQLVLWPTGVIVRPS